MRLLMRPGPQILLALALTGSGSDAAQVPSPIVIHGPPPPVAPAVINRDESGRATVRAVRLDAPIVLDGRLEEGVYRSVPPIGGFLQQEPNEGTPATEETEVWIFFDDRSVYVSARCWDSHPERMVANEMRRDNFGIFNNENFAVVFDTFYDRRNAFFFYTNPIGGLFDGLITDERGVNRDWNTVWDAKTSVFDRGWTVEMVFPFKSLRYRASGEQIWGINFRRVVRWKNELSYLTPIPNSLGPRGITKISSAGTLVGLSSPPESRNLELKPYGITSVITERDSDPPRTNDLGAEAGFDVKYGLTRGLIADFTYNTDFAQVEADEQQVNLTRFSLFFPEKRDFFLEGQGIFNFGGGQAGGGGGGGGFFRRGGGEASNTPILFFSRRIGLEEDAVIPILAGGRITGRAGRYTLGILSISTDEHPPTQTAPTNFSVVRVKRDILGRSTIGVLGTSRSVSAEGDGSNQVAGVDANLAFYENLRVNGYYAVSATTGLSGESASYQAELDYDGDRYGVQLERLAVDRNFNPEVGFLRREDFQRSYASFRFSPRPESIAAIRKIGWEAGLDYTTDNDGVLETRVQKLTFQLDFEAGDQFFVDVANNYEFLPEPFEIHPGIVLPVAGYGFKDARFTYQLGPQRRVSGNVVFQTGEFFSGDRNEVSYRGRIEVSSRLTMEPGISLNWVDLQQGSFTTELLSARVSYNVNPRSFVGAFLQYNSTAGSLSTNVRLRWEYEPGSDVFFVYSDERDTLAPGFPALANRSFVVKVTKLFRF